MIRKATENEIVETARTAAEAQMRYSSVPVMNFPNENSGSETPAGPASESLQE